MNTKEWEIKEKKAKAHLENELEAQARRQGTPTPAVVDLKFHYESGPGNFIVFGFGVHDEEKYFPQTYRVEVYPKFYRVSEIDRRIL